MIKAVIFDLDDTLYYEFIYVKSGFKAAAQYISKQYDVNAEEFYKRLLVVLKSDGRGKTFDLALEYFNLPLSEVDKLIEVYRTHQPTNLELYSDSKYIIEQLKENYKLGLITDGNSTVQWNKIKALGLDEKIDEIIVTGDLGEDKYKPSPVPYEKMLQRLEVKPKTAIYVGDNPEKDFVTARKLGLMTIRIIRDQGMHVDKRLSPKYGADYEIETLNQLIGENGVIK
jgi:putative hydrolase of the HAD superfamily